MDKREELRLKVGMPRTVPLLGRIVAQCVAFGLIALLAGACVSLTVAKTPAQRAYAAVGEYLIVQEAVVAYAESPAAIPNVVKALDGIDQQAQKIITQIQRVVRAPELLAATIDEDKVLGDLTRILDLFRAALVSQLIEAAS